MNLDHIFIDLAVSDPDPAKGEILAIAAVRTDRKGKVLAAFSDKTSRDDDEYSDADFKAAIKGMEDVILAKSFETSYIVVAHFAEIDRLFLKMACDRISHKPFPKRAWLDTAQLAWPLVYNDMISERTLDSLCVHFDIERKADMIDTATGDCEALVRVYWAMMSRYKTALAGEEMVRSVGGETLIKARKMLGGFF